MVWSKKREEFADKYPLAQAIGYTHRIEESLIRLADATKDAKAGRSANAIVQRDTNLARMVMQAATLICPKYFNNKVQVEHSGVTEKRIVVVEKFDGATIKRFSGPN